MSGSQLLRQRAVRHGQPCSSKLHHIYQISILSVLYFFKHVRLAGAGARLGGRAGEHAAGAADVLHRAGVIKFADNVSYKRQKVQKEERLQKIKGHMR